MQINRITEEGKEPSAKVYDHLLSIVWSRTFLEVFQRFLLIG